MTTISPSAIAKIIKAQVADVVACMTGTATPKATRDKILFILNRLGEDVSSVGPEA